VRVFDLGHTEHGDPFIVMELLRGASLGDYIERQVRLSPRKALSLLLPVVSALAAAHARGIIHRDLKPDNIVLMETDSGRAIPKVVDFGIAKIRVDAPGRRGTAEGTVMGSPEYMSPEQARGEVDRVDHRTDVWALAVMLYEMLAGKMPFNGDNHLSLLRDVIEVDPSPLVSLGIDAALSDIVTRAMMKDRSSRTADMATFGRELAAWALGHGMDTDLTGTNIAAHWGRSAHPSLSESISPPALDPISSRNPVESSSATVLPVSGGGAAHPRPHRWIIGAALLVAASGATFLAKLDWKRTTQNPATLSGAAAAMSNATGGRRDGSASEDGLNGPPGGTLRRGDADACLRRLFPPGAFPDGASLSSVCSEVDPRAAASFLSVKVVRPGHGRTTDAMREWAQLSWYELAVVAGMRGACCPATSPELELPASVGNCPPLGTALHAVESAAREESSLAPPLDQFRAAVDCEAAAKRMNPKLPSPFRYAAACDGGASTIARRMLDRSRN